MGNPVQEALLCSTIHTGNKIPQHSEFSDFIWLCPVNVVSSSGVISAELLVMEVIGHDIESRKGIEWWVGSCEKEIYLFLRQLLIELPRHQRHQQFGRGVETLARTWPSRTWGSFGRQKEFKVRIRVDLFEQDGRD
jgi:hypothetical protein